MKTRTTSRIIATTVLLLAFGLAAYAGAGEDARAAGHRAKPTNFVNCNRGDRLGRALRRARPGTTIFVYGTCNERVTINKDRIRLVGRSRNATVDGSGIGPFDPDFNGVITIDGARGVELRNLNVVNGPAEGVLAQRGAEVALHKIDASNNAGAGIAIAQNTTATIVDTQSNDNRIGIDIFAAGTALMRGSVAANDNGFSGIEVNGQSLLELRNAQVEARRNTMQGFVIGSGEVAIFGFPSSQGSSIDASDNGNAGLLFDAGRLVVIGPPAANTITVSGNGQFGTFCPLGCEISNPVGAGRFVISGNPIGMLFGGGSVALFQGGLDVQGNFAFGILADSASGLTLASTPPNPSTVTNNGLDMQLLFGSRVNIDGVAVGSIACDGTEHLSGAACTQ